MNYLIGGGFQDSDGNVLANGKLVLTLSAPCTDLATSLVGICNQYDLSYTLDTDGNVAATPAVQPVWANNLIAPSGTYYMARVFSSAGQLCWGPNPQVINATVNQQPINISTWIPANPT